MSSRAEAHIPTLAEIVASPKNGYKAVSTFSGCGGSSTGLRMAGFDVIWANEFIPAAADTYELNKAPHTVVDRTDIRDVTPETILTATGLSVGELDLFEGSPPCSAFSTEGTREKGWGTVKKYSDGAQRVDDLFFEYARLLRGLQPRTFIAENVVGLTTGSAKGYLKAIVRELESAGYRIRLQVINSADLGLTTRRNRLIFLGVRNDLNLAPVPPRPTTPGLFINELFPYALGTVDSINLRPASARIYAGAILANIGGLSRSSNETFRIIDGATRFSSRRVDGHDGWEDRTTYLDPETGKNLASNSGRPGGAYAGCALYDVPLRLYRLDELRRLSGFPADFALTGKYEQRWERIGRSVPPVMMREIGSAVRGVLDAAA